MSSITLMLLDLRDWTILHAQELDHYIATYPYPHYKHTDTISILRIKIQNIVSQITSVLSHSPSSHSINIQAVEESQFVHYADKLCKVKVTIENIRFSFLAVDAIRTLSSTRILNKIHECIELLGARSQSQHFNVKTYRPRNRSQRSVDYAGTAPAGLMHRLREQIRKKQQDQPKKASTQTNLYEEMDKYLTQKQRKYSRDRVLSNRLYVTPSLEPQRYGYGEEKLDFQKKMIHNSEPQKELISHKHKKRFKYLQEYERQMATKEGDEMQLRNQQLYRTPATRHNYKSLPSTHEGDISPSKAVKLEDEIPQFDEKALDLQGLKQKIDFGVNISKIKHQEENQRWEPFDEDSIDKSADLECNLEDSLEVMKQQQMLNKTGTFNVPVTLAKEPHEYSFGLE